MAGSRIDPSFKAIGTDATSPSITMFFRVDTWKRVARVEPDAFVDHLMNNAIELVVDIPLLHPLERIIGGQNALNPEFDEAPCLWLDNAGARVAAQHTLRALFAGTSFYRRPPGAAVVSRVAVIGGVHRVGA